MLKLGDELFTVGRSTYADKAEGAAESTAKVYVKVRIGEVVTLAQLDTGSPWSIIDPETAGALGYDKTPGEQFSLVTAWGRFVGRLVRMPITLLADEGESLDIDCTFFLASDWPSGKRFLGYSSLLDSIRFALDPHRNDFYFGPSVGDT